MSFEKLVRGHSCRIPLLFLAGTLLPFIAVGQTIEEIVVTAQKRAESVQDVPIAITALDSAVLERNQIENIEDLTNFVPNLQFGNFSSTATAAIRGIGYTNTTAGGDPGVALHLDGVYIARPIATAFRFWDLERMEVLRGPQGTLYGRNTTGGSINFITKRPTQKFGGAIDVSYGEFDHYQVRGVVNLPLSERTAARISAAVDQADGYQKNAFPGGTEAGDRDSVTVRAQLQFDVSDDLDLYLSVNHSQIGGVGSTSESRFPYPTNPALKLGRRTTAIRQYNIQHGFSQSSGCRGISRAERNQHVRRCTNRTWTAPGGTYKSVKSEFHRPD